MNFTETLREAGIRTYLLCQQRRIKKDASSNPYLSNSTTNGLDDFQFVGVDDLDLGFVANESRNSHVRQRRAELYIIWAKLSNAAPFLQRVTGIEHRGDWGFGIETRC